MACWLICRGRALGLGQKTTTEKTVHYSRMLSVSITHSGVITRLLDSSRSSPVSPFLRLFQRRVENNTAKGKIDEKENQATSCIVSSRTKRNYQENWVKSIEAKRERKKMSQDRDLMLYWLTSPSRLQINKKMGEKEGKTQFSLLLFIILSIRAVIFIWKIEKIG